MGWADLSNGDLLAASEKSFDLLITTDQNLKYQQNLAGPSSDTRAANDQLADHSTARAGDRGGCFYDCTGRISRIELLAIHAECEVV